MQTMGCVRKFWNLCVDAFNNNTSIKTEKEYREEFPYMKDVSAAALQQKRRDYVQTKTQYFSKNRKTKLGRMKFKKRGKSRDSYRLPNQKFKINYENSTIRLEKVGDVRVVYDRPIPETAKLLSCTISKDAAGAFFVSVSFETERNIIPLSGKHIGIDFGFDNLFSMSDGAEVTNPRIFRKNQANLRSGQKHLSRKIFKSNRYEKQKRKVGRLHVKIANTRSYHIHNYTTKLVRNYDLICVEDLNLEAMKRKFGKSASDASIGEAIKQLQYKSDWYGKVFVKIDRYFPSTQLCSSCGSKSGPKGLDGLNVRAWKCSGCGIFHNRDINAAKNILKEGYRILTGSENPANINKSAESASNEASSPNKSAELVDYRHGESVRHLFNIADINENAEFSEVLKIYNVIE